MKAALIAVGLTGAALLAGARLAVAADNEAGVPLTPSEAAGAWTVSTAGKDLCVVTLGASHSAKVSANCGDAIPVNATGWQPTKDGMQLTGSGGQPVIAFHRWSNSLLVSHRSSGADIQLRRGVPNA
jgi:protease inhibitor Inh